MHGQNHIKWVEKIKRHILRSVFFLSSENRAVYEMMGKTL